MKKLVAGIVLSVVMCGTLAATAVQESAESGKKTEQQEGVFQVVARWANFVILFGGLVFLLKKPMGEFFSSRRNHISNGLQRAQDAQTSAQTRMNEIEQRLAHLSAEIAA